MSIRLECPNGSCGKGLKVKEELAGKAVKCRACGTVLKVPGVSNGRDDPQAEPVGVDPVLAAAAPVAAAGLWETIDRQCRANRLDATARNVLAAGLFGLFVLAISTLFSWVTMSFGGFQASVAGIQSAAGVLIFLLSLGAGGFALFTFFNKTEWFRHGHFVAGGWAALTFLYLVLQIFRAGSLAGFGLYLGVLAALGVGAAFGFLAFRQVKQ
jgi:hypothetical protein